MFRLVEKRHSLCSEAGEIPADGGVKVWENYVEARIHIRPIDRLRLQQVPGKHSERTAWKSLSSA